VPVAKNTVNEYGINDISFCPNPEYGTFSTAGSHGRISFWDKNVKRCLKKYADVEGCITVIKFNETGSIFAYATGYDWSKGHLYNTSAHPTRVMLHTIKDE
jgi:mRNA export factor